eukprot:COSAG02_NODE_589_length_19902_cov_119.928939_5_plen_62_part_00
MGPGDRRSSTSKLIESITHASPSGPPHALPRVGGMNPRNQIVILHSGHFRMQNSKPIPSGA